LFAEQCALSCALRAHNPINYTPCT
jgi:hypothetical protein